MPDRPLLIPERMDDDSDDDRLPMLPTPLSPQTPKRFVSLVADTTKILAMIEGQSEGIRTVLEKSENRPAFISVQQEAASGRFFKRRCIVKTEVRIDW